MSYRVLLGITGSIAAYKAAELASLLTRAGCSVTAVMTADAQEFITPLTLQVLTKNPVMTGLYDEKQSWRPGHIHLADHADLVVVAPATANVLARLTAGMADDALAAICLATRAPILHAPAMNGNMWSHPATVRNVAILTDWGHQFIGPEAGMLACGYEGPGRLWPVQDIADRALELLRKHPPRDSACPSYSAVNLPPASPSGTPGDAGVERPTSP